MRINHVLNTARVPSDNQVVTFSTSGSDHVKKILRRQTGLDSQPLISQMSIDDDTTCHGVPGSHSYVLLLRLDSQYYIYRFFSISRNLYRLAC